MKFLIIIFLLLSLCDSTLSYLTLTPHFEANPFTQWMWLQFGYAYVLLTKWALIAVVLWIVNYLYKQEKISHAVGILSFSCGALTIICFQLATLL